MRFAARPLLTPGWVYCSGVEKNHISLFSDEQGGMIQYGRADLDSTSNDAKLPLTQLDINHSVCKSERVFPRVKSNIFRSVSC